MASATTGRSFSSCVGLIVIGATLCGFAFWWPQTFVATRIGNSGVLLDPSKLDRRFQDMMGWARTGVQGGIPARNDRRIAARLRPGDDVQKAIVNVAKDGGGVVLLSAGRYPLRERLDLWYNVILRGEDREQTVLENCLRSEVRRDREIVGVLFPAITNAGLEDLTIVHEVVEKMDPNVYQGKYDNDINGIKDLRVGHLNVLKSINCWVDNCRFLYAATDPILVDNSVHITLRGNVVDGSFNKGGDGNGYYEVRRSMYVLCCNETVRNLRHFTIQENSRYVVVLDSRFDVDVNFHGLDDGHNLVENCRISSPVKWWSPIGHWGYKTGEGNLLYRIHVPDTKDGKPGRLYKGVQADPTGVFALSPETNRTQRVFRLDVSPPRGKTLYPMAVKRTQWETSSP